LITSKAATPFSARPSISKWKLSVIFGRLLVARVVPAPPGIALDGHLDT
jgi:hypothetical protein